MGGAKREHTVQVYYMQLLEKVGSNYWEKKFAEISEMKNLNESPNWIFFSNSQELWSVTKLAVFTLVLLSIFDNKKLLKEIFHHF